jgi:hypothetical protein
MKKLVKELAVVEKRRTRRMESDGGVLGFTVLAATS